MDAGRPTGGAGGTGSRVQKKMPLRKNGTCPKAPQGPWGCLRACAGFFPRGIFLGSFLCSFPCRHIQGHHWGNILVVFALEGIFGPRFSKHILVRKDKHAPWFWKCPGGHYLGGQHASWSWKRAFKEENMPIDYENELEGILWMKTSPLWFWKFPKGHID